MFLEILRAKASVLGDSSQHAWTDFLAVMESEDEFAQPSRESVRCEPDWRLSCQPMVSSALKTRLALADGH